jgi:hypothetical protein
LRQTHGALVQEWFMSAHLAPHPQCKASVPPKLGKSQDTLSNTLHMATYCHFFITCTQLTQVPYFPKYEGHLESEERITIKKYLLIIGKKKNMQVLSHTFTHFST